MNALAGYVFLRSSQWMLKKALARAGYRWEERRMGDLKIGLWRKSLRSPLTGPKRRPPGGPRRLVFIPGFCDSALSWFGILTAIKSVMKEDYDELVLVDLPGFFGVLSHEKPFHSADFLVRAMNDVLSSLQPRAIIGHSLGAWLTASYGVFCGTGKVKKIPELLILISPPGVFAEERDKTAFKEMFANVLKIGAAGWRAHIFAREPRWFKLFLPQMEALFKREEILQFIKSFDEQSELRGRIKTIPSEVRLLWGERDTMLPASALPLWLDELKSAQRRPFGFMVRGAGHSLHFESPVCTGAALASLLKGKQTSAFKRNQVVVPLSLAQDEISAANQ